MPTENPTLTENEARILVEAHETNLERAMHTWPPTPANRATLAAMQQRLQVFVTLVQSFGPPLEAPAPKILTPGRGLIIT